MGATNCPETPRQRMIGMMYLVLTAMLALNVSKDILNAFSTVDEALTMSTQITNKGISGFQRKLALEKASQGEAKVKNAEIMVNEIVRESDQLVDYIEKMKVELLIAVDGTEKTEDGKIKTANDIKSKDNISKAHRFMFGEDKALNSGKAVDLRKKIEAYRNKILSFVKPEGRQIIGDQIGLKVNENYKNKDGAPENWEVHYFGHQIMIATYTLLNKTIGEIRNAQSIMLNYAIGSTTADDFKFNQIQARAIPVSQMVFQGDKYSADVIVAAFDDRQSPEVYYRMGADTLISTEGATRLDGQNGIVKLEIPAGSPGEQKFAGFIRVTKPDGTQTNYAFKDKYTVLKPSATVAAEKMNVFYANIDNPVSVNAPVAPDKISINLTGGGTATKTAPGNFNVRVTDAMVGRTVTVNVSAESGGRTAQMGGTVFRVKRVPDPQARIGGNYTGGRVSKNDLLANPFINAQMPQDFAYQLQWKITAYQVIFNVKGMEDTPITVQGGAFTETLKTKIKNAIPGTVIIFQGIKTSSEAGPRSLNEITVRIK
ncbi:MAG: gliding motility-associated protein GldM [Bacteroidetes bacterium]|nr:gliding motility-associated protein GldM [Bacteroidota bacterium]